MRLKEINEKNKTITVCTFPLGDQPYAATVDMVSTPKAPAPENLATLLPNTESNENDSKITNLLCDTLA